MTLWVVPICTATLDYTKTGYCGKIDELSVKFALIQVIDKPGKNRQGEKDH